MYFCMVILPYVPIKKMKKAMDIIAGIAADLPNKEQLTFGKKFLKYLAHQWIKEYDPNNLESWNFYSKKGSYTNNPR